MALLFFTDPHLGLQRQAGTTTHSQKALREKLFQVASSIVDRPDGKVCLGDLFDTYHNDELTIGQGAAIAEGAWVVAGNHDLSNRDDKMGSLELIHMLNRSQVALVPFGEAGYVSQQFFVASSATTPPCDVGESVTVVAVPHVASQELFEHSLSLAQEHAASTSVDKRFLVLHCNVDIEFESTETALNLSLERAEELLQTFDYILVGHDHSPKDLLGGRLIVLGNTHPTGFGDISPKRIARYADGRMTFEWIWDPKEGYLEVDHRHIPESTEANFVRVVGTCPVGDLPEVAKKIAALWKASPNLYAVKSSVEVVGDTGEPVAAKVELATLPDTIRKSLAGTDLAELFEELMEDAV